MSKSRYNHSKPAPSLTIYSILSTHSILSFRKVALRQLGAYHTSTVSENVADTKPRDGSWKRLRGLICKLLRISHPAIDGTLTIGSFLKEEWAGIKAGSVLYVVLLLVIAGPYGYLFYVLGKAFAEPTEISAAAEQQPVSGLEPIASISATAVVFIVSADKVNNAYPAPQARISFIKGTTVLVIADAYQLTAVSSESQKDTIKYKAVCIMSDDAELMGQPIANLASADSIRIDFESSELPAENVISGGNLVCVINNKIPLRFEVPPQKSRKLEGTGYTTILIKNVDSNIKRQLDFLKIAQNLSAEISRPDITAYEGNSRTTLDGQPTVNLPYGTVYVLYVNGGRSTWMLTDSKLPNGPGVVRGADFDPIANPKVWIQNS